MSSPRDNDSDDDVRPPTPKRGVDPLVALKEVPADKGTWFVCGIRHPKWDPLCKELLFAVVDIVDGIDAAKTEIEEVLAADWATVRVKAGTPIVLADDPKNCANEVLIRHVLQRHVDNYHNNVEAKIDHYRHTPIKASPLHGGSVLVTVVPSTDGPLVVPMQYHTTDGGARVATEKIAKEVSGQFEFDVVQAPAGAGWNPRDVARARVQCPTHVSKLDEALSGLVPSADDD